MKNLWKKFKDLSEKGYLGMIRPDIDMKVWDEAFDVLMEIVKTGREKNSGYGEKLYYLDEMTDYEFKISVWLEDYLNEADMREQYDKVEKICKLLLETFVWDETESESGDVLSEANPVYFKFRLAAALGAQGKNQEAVDFCQKWYSQQKTDAAGDREKTQKKEDNKWNEIWAATALIYAKLGAQDVEGAGEIVNAHVSEDTVCGSENEILCTAALLYYQVSGKKEAERRMKEQIEQFQKENEDFFDMPENFDFTEEMSRFGFSEESGFSYENGSEK